MTTFVLWFMLQGGQMVTIPGFMSQQNCNEVGAFYQEEAKRSKRPLEFRCGPGPDIGGGANVVVPRAMPFSYYRN